MLVKAATDSASTAESFSILCRQPTPSFPFSTALLQLVWIHNTDYAEDLHFYVCYGFYKERFQRCPSGHLFNKRADVLTQEIVKTRISGLDFFNCSEMCRTHRQQRCRDARQIAERVNQYNIQSRGFETSRDLAVQHPSIKWIKAPGLLDWHWHNHVIAQCDGCKPPKYGK